MMINITTDYRCYCQTITSDLSTFFCTAVLSQLIGFKASVGAHSKYNGTC